MKFFLVLYTFITVGVNRKADPSHISTSVALSAKIELGELDVGPQLSGVVLLDVLKPRKRRPLWVRHIQVVHSENWRKEGKKNKRMRMWICVPVPHGVMTAPPLTHVVCDDGEGLQVGFPDILCQRVGVLLEAVEQMGGTALCLLDLLPVLLVGWIQYGATCSHQVLRGRD